MQPLKKQPRIQLNDNHVYDLLKAKKNIGVLNSNFDFVDLEMHTGEILKNRIIEDAEYLVLYHHETLIPEDIKEIRLCDLEWALK